MWLTTISGEIPLFMPPFPSTFRLRFVKKLTSKRTQLCKSSNWLNNLSASKFKWGNLMTESFSFHAKMFMFLLLFQCEISNRWKFILCCALMHLFFSHFRSILREIIINQIDKSNNCKCEWRGVCCARRSYMFRQLFIIMKTMYSAVCTRVSFHCVCVCARLQHRSIQSHVIADMTKS